MPDLDTRLPGLVGCSVGGTWVLWVGAGLTLGQAMVRLAELNVYYRILCDQGVPFPFASPRPFGVLLQALGLTLLLGWGLATLCRVRGRRRSAFSVSLLAVAAVITALILQLLSVVEPHHSAKAVSQAIVAQAAPDDVIVYEGSLGYFSGRARGGCSSS